MNFESLLHVAQKNSVKDKKNEQSKYYSTKFEAPKKESKEKKLSANIQKFLQKREEEEKEKARIEKLKLQELIASRDEKAKNKIKKMLKVTKSANKSVLDDAVDNNNTAYTLDGPLQPDEDDYGYVSQEASQYYKTLMDKYGNDPVEDKKKPKGCRPATKSDLLNTKDRVRAALEREREEELAPHRRQRQSKSTSIGSGAVADEIDADSQSSGLRKSRKNLYDPEMEKQLEEQLRKEEHRAKAKSRPMPPPAMDFRQLLQLAEKKQFETIEVEVEEKPKEPERLLTNREKRELEERRAYLENRKKSKCSRTEDGPRKETKSMPSNDQAPRKMEPNGRIPKLNSASSSASASSRPKVVPQTKTSNNASSSSSKPATVQPQKLDNGIRKSVPSSSASSAPRPSSATNARPTLSATSARSSLPAPNSRPTLSSSSSKPSVSSSSRPMAASSLSSKSSSSRPSSTTTGTNGVKSSAKPTTRITPTSNSSAKVGAPPSSMANQKSMSNPKLERTREFPPKDVVRKGISSVPAPVTKPSTSSGVAKKPIEPVKTRPFPPFATTQTRQFPPNDIQRSRPPVKKKPVKRHIIEDDDSEYDSEMDDFIDDGPEEGDYSKYIKEIFGYDKSRYKHVDDDDDNMESTFAQQMREEFLSKKAGLMEDLEDMRLEAEEKKRAAKKKRRL